MQVNLSDSEWKLMNRLWEQSPRTIMFSPPWYTNVYQFF